MNWRCVYLPRIGPPPPPPPPQGGWTMDGWMMMGRSVRAWGCACVCGWVVDGSLDRGRADG